MELLLIRVFSEEVNFKTSIEDRERKAVTERIQGLCSRKTEGFITMSILFFVVVFF